MSEKHVYEGRALATLEEIDDMGTFKPGMLDAVKIERMRILYGGRSIYAAVWIAAAMNLAWGRLNE